jgi:hypothetical protein
MVSSKNMTKEDIDKWAKDKADSFLKRKARGVAIDKVSGSTRFRKVIFGIQRLLVNKELLEDLYTMNHPQRHLIADLSPPDLDFAEAIAPILVEINKSINLMESDTDINGSSFYEETKRLMHLAIDNISSTRSDLCAFSRSLLISLVEQISGRRLDNFGNEIGCKVPLRFSEKDLAAIYLSPKSCFVDFNSVSKRLEESNLSFLNKINV